MIDIIFEQVLLERIAEQRISHDKMFLPQLPGRLVYELDIATHSPISAAQEQIGHPRHRRGHYHHPVPTFTRLAYNFCSLRHGADRSHGGAAEFEQQGLGGMGLWG